MTEHDREPPEPEAPVEAPPAEARRRLRRPAPESDVKAYIAPVELPENQDDARRTQELSRVQISPELDPRRRPTVRRAGPPVDAPQAAAREELVVEETAPLGTNLRAIQEASRKVAPDDPRMREFKQATLRMRPDAPVASPSAPTDARGGAAHVAVGPDQHAGPRGTMLLNPRARGGTKMMIGGVESAALPRRRGSDASDEIAGERSLLRILVLGAVVILGLATLALFASRGIVSSSSPSSPDVRNVSDETGPRSRPVEAAPSFVPPPLPDVTVAPAMTASEAAPSATAAASEEPSDAPPPASAAAPKRGRNRAKPPTKRAPDAASSAPRGPTPMFERSKEAH